MTSSSTSSVNNSAREASLNIQALAMPIRQDNRRYFSTNLLFLSSQPFVIEARRASEREASGIMQGLQAHTLVVPAHQAKSSLRQLARMLV